ncbi:MAG: hypothetical protein GFH27_549297n112 [Chloroflexi bacterium AL-W]|nr:hypothetical protein [Chloroflexi bacterium AL-N1]NOK68636.1 hypothetical protein [Chloroflexi bacterium AL-N10]NOK76122.1 hypothetical protein [Chloroflexi bacterium AL-N5]NOK82595.1 hypothetical protein [Chloroflexi bacterium AL-W]NOK93393.1 hypothetical protein [Chloroflexi bacterium AL-N15]
MGWVAGAACAALWAAPAPPRHTGNHTPAPVTPPSPPMTLPQDVPRGGNIQGTPWDLDETLVCTQEGFPMLEGEDFQVTIFPAPEKGEMLVLMIGELPLFDREGILYTKHFPGELNNDNISEEEVLDTFLNGKKYQSSFGDAIVYKAIPGQPKNGVTIVVSKSERKAITAWRGDEKRSWRCGWPYMTWYP